MSTPTATKRKRRTKQQPTTSECGFCEYPCDLVYTEEVTFNRGQCMRPADGAWEFCGLDWGGIGGVKLVYEDEANVYFVEPADREAQEQSAPWAAFIGTWRTLD